MKKAYTLPELLIVSAIIALIISSAIPVFRTNLVKFRLKNTAKEIIEFIEEQRIRAEKLDLVCEASFTPDNNKFVSSCTESLEILTIDSDATVKLKKSFYIFPDGKLKVKSGRGNLEIVIAKGKNEILLSNNGVYSAFKIEVK